MTVYWQFRLLYDLVCVHFGTAGNHRLYTDFPSLKTFNLEDELRESNTDIIFRWVC
jgi:hypothetical protein